MSDPNLLFWAISFAVFASVAGLTFWSGSLIAQRGAVRQRLAPAARENRDFATDQARSGPKIGGKRARVDAALGLTDATKGVQRAELLRAGYFGPNAVLAYNTIRLANVIAFPLVVYALLSTTGSDLGALGKFAVLGGSLLLAYYIPEAFIKRRQRALQEKFRLVFPDFLDLLVVCVDAGLSLDAALERVTGEVTHTSRELGVNLAMMAGETRAGRGIIDALHSLASRLGIDEARSLAMLLQQSVELGTDIVMALRTYSDEMREKRLSRAEEKANALPVKIVFPLGVFIFPVILVLIMVPMALRVVGAMAGF